MLLSIFFWGGGRGERGSVSSSSIKDSVSPLILSLFFEHKKKTAK
jgi:hypothetical protein